MVSLGERGGIFFVLVRNERDVDFPHVMCVNSCVLVLIGSHSEE